MANHPVNYASTTNTSDVLFWVTPRHDIAKIAPSATPRMCRASMIATVAAKNQQVDHCAWPTANAQLGRALLNLDTAVEAAQATAVD